MFSEGQSCNCDLVFKFQYWDGKGQIDKEIWFYHEIDSIDGGDSVFVNNDIYKFKVITFDCKGSANIIQYDTTGTIVAKFIFMKGIDKLKSQNTIYDDTGEIYRYRVHCYYEAILVEYFIYNQDGTVNFHWKDNLKWMKYRK